MSKASCCWGVSARAGPMVAAKRAIIPAAIASFHCARLRVSTRTIEGMSMVTSRFHGTCGQGSAAFAWAIVKVCAILAISPNVPSYPPPLARKSREGGRVHGARGLLRAKPERYALGLVLPCSVRRHLGQQLHRYQRLGRIPRRLKQLPPLQIRVLEGGARPIGRHVFVFDHQDDAMIRSRHSGAEHADRFRHDGAVESRLSSLRELLQEILQATRFDLVFEDRDHGHGQISIFNRKHSSLGSKANTLTMGGYTPVRAALIARHTLSAVIGMSMWRMPYSDSASMMAFGTATMAP